MFSCLTYCLLSACSNQGVNRADVNNFVEVIYGKVIRLEPITFDSKADEAAVVGGVEGALENSDEHFEDIITGAVTGALVSALFVRVEEGSDQGLIVDLKTPDKTNYSLPLKTTKINLGECLRVIKGDEVSFKIVSDEFCS